MFGLGSVLGSQFCFPTRSILEDFITLFSLIRRSLWKFVLQTFLAYFLERFEGISQDSLNIREFSVLSPSFTGYFLVFSSFYQLLLRNQCFHFLQNPRFHYRYFKFPEFWGWVSAQSLEGLVSHRLQDDPFHLTLLKVQSYKFFHESQCQWYKKLDLGYTSQGSCFLMSSVHWRFDYLELGIVLLWIIFLGLFLFLIPVLGYKWIRLHFIGKFFLERYRKTGC